MMKSNTLLPQPSPSALAVRHRRLSTVFTQASPGYMCDVRFLTPVHVRSIRTPAIVGQVHVR